MEKVHERLFRSSRELRRSLSSLKLSGSVSSAAGFIGRSALQGIIGAGVLALAGRAWSFWTRPARRPRGSGRVVIPFPLDRVGRR